MSKEKTEMLLNKLSHALELLAEVKAELETDQAEAKADDSGSNPGPPPPPPPGGN